ncbi:MULTISPECIES: serine hydroxymethyltransferase [Terrisporobacter]|uniref:Probable serine hydroxymethyltransferase n=2 Tax=Terrisporobacter TaxID=1505652 RepID=A0A0B3WV17_9FIRM|nr:MULTISPECIES: serine hydroxymethyltransferase [Terrisporobacter]KHS58430.1 serine hydroxymethyltransferase [Terrisporobacter othiniensis]MCC3669270.1 serine hydroxymethyltransferase [Terrisporobacter mayombei]MCR1823165.1 serine hydroxymethyltransferase [Terrisporobacter muris]MDU6983704.1 serine hydroxymethyltransferase [Terrisporobacter othiniensis]MDY3374395.1 serine hydroxymethyltransferase [Terrisporobacter othiniensis]
MLKTTKITDPKLYSIVEKELERQKYNIEMIASESSAPTEILELMGSVFVNKTEEGLPGKRYQAGSEFADEVENLCIERAKEAFGCEYVNVQAYSGATANYTVFNAVLEPGDKILAMRLDHGGHLTHGSPANFVSKIYKYEHYGVDIETERINYDEVEAKALEFKPKMIIAGASAYPRLIDYERMREIADKVGAYLMVDMAHISGLIGAGVIPSPIPYADFATSSCSKTICGPRGGFVMCKEKYAKALNKATFPGTLGSIQINGIAAKANMFKRVREPEFIATMQRVLDNAKYLAKELEQRGFRIISGGTDNHIVLVDLRPKKITGKQFDQALESIGITVNKNTIPDDPESPFVTSGVRIGLTAVSERGFGNAEIAEIADIMEKVADNIDNEEVLNECRVQARNLISRFPLYPKGYFED